METLPKACCTPTVPASITFTLEPASSARPIAPSTRLTRLMRVPETRLPPVLRLAPLARTTSATRRMTTPKIRLPMAIPAW